MAKRKSKAAQWVKVEGVGWVKVHITRCPKGHAYGVKSAWSPKARVDMSRRGEIHVTHVNGALKAEVI
jgi:hypothetical protein